ncbi:hypothetical protein SCATT_45460 [Streptantibioticus cattleyicolor NRRL 8057 = DSM 46488]|uniref:Uncharacterized protein n=1 Tax=Streptantibioticus cattleyicolor (strain ATCC 35852 / DSM 46488 / JCM 4925 / NBRC 14057 / NRRL 8057) TaxID=1003195 RepID=G8X0K3_STREN|nr:hypothetical protein SCATT_45460 [Streptantibioticus cattleyicolor NRRL 8057 = DSM 46488]
MAAGAAAELDPLRAACYDAVGVLAAARPEKLVVVGAAEQSGRGPHPQGAGGSFRDVGVHLDVTLGERHGDVPGRPLPPSLTVAAWLLTRTEWSASPVEGLGVGEPLAAEECLAVGGEVAASARRVALLVAGDGSARRSVKAPGYLDERAAAFDASVAGALAAADTDALAALDGELAAALMATGRAPWQVLAGAGRNAGLRGELLYDHAPYGVGYFVATWS